MKKLEETLDIRETFFSWEAIMGRFASAWVLAIAILIAGCGKDTPPQIGDTSEDTTTNSGSGSDNGSDTGTGADTDSSTTSDTESSSGSEVQCEALSSPESMCMPADQCVSDEAFCTVIPGATDCLPGQVCCACETYKTMWPCLICTTRRPR
jgi:hypothetical protein